MINTYHLTTPSNSLARPFMATVRLMFEALINISLEVGAAVSKLLPKSFQRKVDPDSTLGQVLGLLLGISLLIGVAVIIYAIR